MTHSQSVGLPWKSDQPVPEVSSCNNTQHSQETNIHTSGGVQISNLSKRVAIGLRLWPRGHRVGTTIIKEWKYLLLLRPIDPSSDLGLPSNLRPVSPCLAADRQFLIVSNMAASVGTIGKCNVGFSSTNVIPCEHTHTHTETMWLIYGRWPGANTQTQRRTNRRAFTTFSNCSDAEYKPAINLNTTWRFRPVILIL